VEFYSSHRAQRSIRRADVVLLFFDATQRISKVDKQLCDYIAQQYKPCMFVVNKWDRIAGTMPTDKWVGYLRDKLSHHVVRADRIHHRAVGQERQAMLNHSQMLFGQSRERVPTSQLNKTGADGDRPKPPPAHQKPAGPKLLHHSGGHPAAYDRSFLQRSAGDFSQYQRYLLRVFREELEFGEVPIKLYLRRREHGDTRNEIEAKQEG